MENKLKVWIARDKDGELYAYAINRPIKFLNCWFSSFSGYLGKSKKFPSVKWEDDEPTEAYIALAEPQEQPEQEHPTPKQEIDWEQRQYELTKDILIKTYFDKKNKHPLLYNSDIHSAISYANKIIDKLKEQNK